MLNIYHLLEPSANSRDSFWLPLGNISFVVDLRRRRKTIHLVGAFLDTDSNWRSKVCVCVIILPIVTKLELVDNAGKDGEGGMDNERGMEQRFERRRHCCCCSLLHPRPWNRPLCECKHVPIATFLNIKAQSRTPHHNYPKLQSMMRPNRDTIEGYFLAGKHMFWLPVRSSY